MDEKRSRASKRKSMTSEEGFWDCSVCTYRNSAEAFKCEMCDVRKGTSTRSGRKPRINPQVVMQQVAQQVFTPPVKKDKKETGKKTENVKKEGEIFPKEASTSKENSPKTNSNKKIRPPRLKNIDRSSGRSMEVTVGNVTVVITDYQPKKTSDNANKTLSPTSTASSTKDSPTKNNMDDKQTKSENIVNGEAAATRDES